MSASERILVTGANGHLGRRLIERIARAPGAASRVRALVRSRSAASQLEAMPAELRPETRYDQVVSALGGAGETVTDSRDIAPALARAFASGVPYLVNVITDPDDEYPRQSALG